MMNMHRLEGIKYSNSFYKFLISMLETESEKYELQAK